ncbi:FAD-binding oxidoreductase [Actinoplanes sp. NPDC051859]|uniref:FAD-binding oxidoreductase n=1 Tax=Actinoplanes sp. NPDC051859 TaxID=3363909 RepID=UPI003787D1E5
MGNDLPARKPLLRALTDLCGPGYARLARRSDAVCGRHAAFVAAPPTTGAVVVALRLAAERGLSVSPRGSGSKIDWCCPGFGADLILDTHRLDGIHRVDPADPTATVVAEVGVGMPVRSLGAALAPHGLRLAVDPPSPTATVGGMLALNETGPLRHRFGTAAGQVESVTYATGSGDHVGAGPLDAAGVIVSARVRLEPLPAARRWVVAPVTAPRDIHDLVQETLAQQVRPSAVEIDLPVGPAPAALAVLIEGDPREVAERTTRLQQALHAGAESTAEAPSWWGRYPFGPTDVALRIAVPPEELQAAVFALRDVAGAPVPVRGAAGRGIVHAALPGSVGPERAEGILDAVRGVLLARGGRCVAIAAPPHLGAALHLANRRDLF